MSLYEKLSYRKREFYTNSRKEVVWKAVCGCIIFVFVFTLHSHVTAQTNGPVQPEFTKFESVGTINMVDLFSGDFTYNIPIIQIPGPNGLNYSLSLSYHSGVPPDEEASWVGYGWTLNPGSIIRNKKGYPDDVNGGTFTNINNVPANKTVGLAAAIEFAPEAASTDIVSAGDQFILEYNNYRHLTFKEVPWAGFNLGLASLNLSLEDGNLYYKANASPAAILSNASTLFNASESTKSVLSRFIAPNLNLATRESFFLNKTNTVFQKYSGSSYKLNIGLGPSVLPIPAGAHIGSITGYYNVQEPETETNLTYYGYLYNGNATENDLMDYFTEKQYPFIKKDRFLAIPYSNADYFNVTGEGIGGSFRFYNKNATHFAPNAVKNKTTITQLGFEVLLGGDMDLGADVEGQYQELEIGEWYAGNTFRYSNGEDESYYIKFSSDLGSAMSFNNDELQRANLENGGGTFPGTKDYSASVSGLNESVNDGERVSRSSFITWHTNAEMTGNYSGTNRYQRYDRSNDDFVDRSDEKIKDGIGEFVAFDKNGTRYVYGLPVYSCNEENLSMSINEDVDFGERSKIVYADVSDPERKVGEKMEDPYASTFLLTEITSADYVDLKLDGLSADDLGEYVKFEYVQIYGSKKKSDAGLGNWYHWRIPYNGLLYDDGQLSDPDDNMGSYISGDKEVYYLKTITTKTHKAVFILNSEPRLDGLDAEDDDLGAAKSSTATGEDSLNYLSEVELYALGQDGAADQLIQRTYFNYDYSLCPGTPNSAADGKGKLTLKKLWTEYANVYPAKVSSYEFKYEYPGDGTYPEKYNELDNYGGYSSSQQNPDYDPYAVDSWGYYQGNGINQFKSFSNSVNQKGDATFDPAAYHLKVIKLPSGGEIHVQYEQDDYNYVQDRTAMFMVPLYTIVPGTTGIEGNGYDYYYLNLAAVGVDTSDHALLNSIKDKIDDAFISGTNADKIYFKFFYDLDGSDDNICNPEYFEGYSKVENVEVDGSFIKIKFKYTSDDNDVVPRTLCKEYYQTHMQGQIKFDHCLLEELNVADDAEEAIYTLLDKVTEFSALTDAATSFECREINDTLSYLRIPMGQSKKGGGVRVKRLLMWDKGLEDNDTALYGQEYIYKDENGLSTGVATNEPATLGRENALVTFLDRSDSYNGIEKLLRGGEKDLEQYSGPIGEGILPGASVGYSKVISKNIHEGKTNPGFDVTEFYTTHDYPFDGYLDSIKSKGADYTDILEEKDPFFFTSVISSELKTSFWVSQGYRFILNDMHGKIKKASTYQGEYVNIMDITQASLSTQQSYTYSEPGEALTVMDEWGKYESKQLGKEMEVVFDSRQISDVAYDGSLECDANILIYPWPPFIAAAPTFMLYTNVKQDQLKTHVTNKIIKYPSVLKSVTSFKDGVYSTTENLVFDKYTGDPIITRSYDSYNGLDLQKSANHAGNYLNYQIPSSYYYDGMGPKYLTDRMVFNSDASLTISKQNESPGVNYLEFTGDDACSAASLFTPGDWIALNTGSTVEVYFADTLVENKLYIESNPNFDNNDNEYATVNLEIIRTARSNQLSDPASKIVTYGASIDDYSISYDSRLSSRNQIANQLNKLLSAVKSTHTKRSKSMAITDGLETDGACKEGTHLLRIDVIPFSTSSDDILFCVSEKTSSAGSKMTHSSVTVASKAQALFLNKAPGKVDVNENPNPNQNNTEADSTELKQYAPLESCRDLICQCESGSSAQVTKLDDVIPGEYWLPTDTIKSTVASGFEFKFTVEDGLEAAGKYVDADYFVCGLSIDSSVALDVLNCNMVLLDSSYYDRDINKVCFYYCDDTAFIDSIFIESETSSFEAGSNRISNFEYYVTPLHVHVTELTPGPVFHGKVEIWSDSIYDSFKKITLYSQNLIIDSIQFCVSDSINLTDTTDNNVPHDTIASSCCDTLNLNGYFSVDSLNGELVYYGDGWCTYEILDCINLCPNFYPKEKLKNVVSATENIMSSDWSYQHGGLLEKYYELDKCDYHNALKGIWRPWYNAAYKEIIEGIYIEDDDRAYNSGYFDELTLFNHKYLEANLNTKWIPQNKAELVTPNGNVVESKNALDIPFSSQYGDASNLPLFKASNADYYEVSFSSIDYGLDYYASAGTQPINDVIIMTGGISPTVTKTDEAAHSGVYSLKLSFTETEDYLELRPFTLTSRYKDDGILISLWVKATSDLATNLTFVDADSHIPNAAFSKIAKTGEWTLFEVTLKEFASLSVGSEFKPRIYLTTPGDISIIHNYYVDDIRIQPVSAQVTCYVYDSKQRLIVVFDDDHFGEYYLYDLEGRLNKRVRETERGMYLIQENYNNTSKSSK